MSASITAPAVAPLVAPFVDFNNVYLAYDGTTDFAVEDISLQTQAGEFIAIVGPSGCGKSTFMSWPPA